MKTFNISVIVCTKNRNEKIFETIDSIFSQKTNDAFTYEVVIIDSSDINTMKNKLLHRYSNSIIYYWNPSLNLSEARNYGIDLTNANIVVFIDDDGIADDSWLFEHYKLYADPSVVSVGGKIIPKWLNDIPNWLSPELITYFSGYFSLLDIGTEVREIQYPEIPYGCNMSFRKDVFLKEILFDKKLGRMGDTLMSNEEDYLYYTLNQQGKKIMYTPFAIVNHQINTSRMNKSFIKRRSYWDGVSRARMNQKILNKSQRSFIFLNFLIKRIPKNIFGYFLSFLLKNNNKSLIYFSRIIQRSAYLFEELRSLPKGLSKH